MWSITKLAAWLLVLVANSEIALAETGTWVGEPNFSQLNAACFRLYRCGPTTDQMFDSATHKLVVPAPETVTGVCTGYDSCNECNTNEPTTPCEWSIVPK